MFNFDYQFASLGELFKNTYAQVLLQNPLNQNVEVWPKHLYASKAPQVFLIDQRKTENLAGQR